MADINVCCIDYAYLCPNALIGVICSKQWRSCTRVPPNMFHMLIIPINYRRNYNSCLGCSQDGYICPKLRQFLCVLHAQTSSQKATRSRWNLYHPRTMVTRALWNLHVDGKHSKVDSVPMPRY